MEYSINGFVGNKTEICEHFNLKYNTVYVRMKRNNETFEEAVNFYIKNGIRNNDKYHILGFYGNKTEICNHFNVNYYSVNSEMHQNHKTFEEIVKRKIKTGSKRGKIFKINGFIGNELEICNHFGLNIYTIRSRMKYYNIDFKEALNYYLIK